MAYTQSFPAPFTQQLLGACVVDTTPPTFSGVTSIDVFSRGQIRTMWGVGSDATLPIRYEVYIQASTSVGLFNTNNITAITPNLQYDIFTLPDGSALQEGTTYYVGVRAVDAVGNRDNNTTSLSVISTGILTSIDVYSSNGVFSFDTSNQFRATLWANKNSSLAISPDAVLGTASYQVYDRSGNAISGMSATGLTANAQGMYIAPAIPNLIEKELIHYVVKVTINVDGENRINHIPIYNPVEEYDLTGTLSINESNAIVGSFWVTENQQILTTNLGTASYQIYEANGTIVTGATQSGIAADANGFFAITPLALPGTMDLKKTYIARVSITVEGIIRQSNVVISQLQADYSCKATFSINALNQLQGTFWSTVNDILVDTALLGTASYQIYDAAGNAVVGLAQTGISANGQGMFFITPASATLLTDLTHYTAKVTIMIAGQNRVVFKGFSLLGN